MFKPREACYRFVNLIVQFVSSSVYMAPKLQRKPAGVVRKRPSVKVMPHTRRARKCGLKYKVPQEPKCKRCGHPCQLCNPPAAAAPPAAIPHSTVFVQPLTGAARPDALPPSEVVVRRSRKHVDVTIAVKTE